jgi:hypothetical protein
MRAAIAVASAAAVLASACTIDPGIGVRVPSAPAPSVAKVAVAAPPGVTDPRGDGSSGHTVAGRPGPPPDADGNPACPAVDEWGASGGHTGIVVSYWGHGADYVTVLVRTTRGPDVARSIAIQPRQALQLFEFSDIEPAVVDEVLIITNDTRCYATADPAITKR